MILQRHRPDRGGPGATSATAGGRAIAEMTVMGWGRDVAVLRDIARAPGVHVIATSGFYVEDCIPEFARDRQRRGADRIPAARADRRRRRHRHPHRHPEVRGRPTGDRGARAALRRSRCAGAARRPASPITTHTSGSSRFEIPGGNLGAQHLDLFEAEGVDPCARHHRPQRRERRYPLPAVAGAPRRLRPVRRDRQDRIGCSTRPGSSCWRGWPMPAIWDRLLLSTDRCRVTELKVEGRPRLRPPAAQLCSQAAAGRLRRSGDPPDAGRKPGADPCDRRRLNVLRHRTA